MATEQQDQARKRKLSPNGDGGTLKRKQKRQRKQSLENAQSITESALAVQPVQQSQQPSWLTSGPIGGSYINVPPMFSLDEKYILVATTRAIQVFETSTSLLARKLSPLPQDGSITSYCTSTSNPSHVYASTKDGHVYLWDLTSGKQISKWSVNSRITGIATSQDAPGQPEVVYTLEDPNGGGSNQIRDAEDEDQDDARSYNQRGSIIKVRNLTSEDSAERSVKILDIAAARTQDDTFSESIRSFGVYLNGKVVVAAFKTCILIGERHPTEKLSLEGTVYTWRELNMSRSVLTFDARTRLHSHASGKKNRSGSSSSIKFSLDIAVATDKGEIMLFEDILNKLTSFEETTKTPSGRMSRILQWHRYPPRAVRWSQDGNYVISGGAETTIVLWQLATNRKQFLPHLMAEISHITVSPSGASYAIELSDNSLIVLSTSELTPTTSVAGIQSQVLQHDLVELRQIERSQLLQEQTVRSFTRFRSICPARLDPKQPSQILMAVPGHRMHVSEKGSEVSAPYLQRFDISTARHISRQALTRTNATIGFDAPYRQRYLRDPVVTLLDVTPDGEWMATIDEWYPRELDLDHLGREGKDPEETLLRRETYLKIWRRTEDGSWALNTRIDGPHAGIEKTTFDRVYALIASPEGTSFSTVGEDGTLRIWRPKTRLSNGIYTRGIASEGTVMWSNAVSTELEGVSIEEDDNPKPFRKAKAFACATYSPDASLIATSQQSSDTMSQGLVHLIDASTGRIERSLTNVWQTALFAIGIAGQYCIILSDNVTVWDLVNDSLTFEVPIPQNYRTHWWPRLSVNQFDNTFAVATAFINNPAEDATQHWDSKIQVYSLEDGKCLSDVDNLDEFVMNMLPNHGAPGYVVIDTAAQIWTLSPRSNTAISIIPETSTVDGAIQIEDEDDNAIIPDVDVDSDDEDEDVDMQTSPDPEAEAKSLITSQSKQEGSNNDILEDTEGDDRPIVRPEQLAEIFEIGPSFALPPVKDLFGKIVGLYAKKSNKKHLPLRGKDTA